MSQTKSRNEGFKENHSPFGKRNKEKKNQNLFSKRAGGGLSRLFGGRSRGNVDFFASSSIISKRGFLGSLFRSKHSGNTSLRRTNSPRGEDKRLFKRNLTNQKISIRKKQDKQNRKRERNRVRGNVLFAKRKR